MVEGAEEPPAKPQRRRKGVMAALLGDGDETADASRSAYKSDVDKPDKPERAPAPVEVFDKKYMQHVAHHIQLDGPGRDAVGHWQKKRGESTDLTSHVEDVFAASGMASDLETRLEQVRAAVKKQHQLMQDRRQKKKLRDRMRDATKLAVEGELAPQEQGIAFAAVVQQAAAEAGFAGGATSVAEHVAGDAGGSATAAADSQEVKWTLVQAFKTQEEAFRFATECQPFDYQPCPPSATSTQPPPVAEFASADGEFRRRFRIRKEEVEETRELSVASVARQLRKGRTGKILGAKSGRTGRFALELDGVPKEVKPWLVEATGQIFERPAVLRELCRRDVSARYFVAVTPEVEKQIFAEGFRLKRRCSIPCSATPQDALAVFNRGEHRGNRAVVLAVTLPPEMGIDVVAHKNGGFQIRCTELPPSCFSRTKRAGGVSDGG